MGVSKRWWCRLGRSLASAGNSAPPWGPGSTPAESATPDMRLTETVPLAQLLVRYLQALNEGPKFLKEVIVCYED